MGMTRNLRIDGRMMSGRHGGINEEAFFVTHEDGEKPERPTLVVGALCRSAADQKWFEKVVKLIEGLEVPR